MVSFVFSSFAGMFFNFSAISIVVAVQSLSLVGLFATPWTVAIQASLSFTVSWSLLKFMSIESMMSSNHFFLCHPLLLLLSVFSSIRSSELPRFPGPLLRRTRGPDPSSKATLWLKEQHEGALSLSSIVRKHFLELCCVFDDPMDVGNFDFWFLCLF